MPGESWRYGDMTTMPSGRIRRSETRRHCKRAERLSNLRAPRPARLPKPKPMIIKIKPADSRYERGTEGGQVRRCRHVPSPQARLRENRRMSEPLRSRQRRALRPAGLKERTASHSSGGQKRQRNCGWQHARRTPAPWSRPSRHGPRPNCYAFPARTVSRRPSAMVSAAGRHSSSSLEMPASASTTTRPSASCARSASGEKTDFLQAPTAVAKRCPGRCPLSRQPR